MVSKDNRNEWEEYDETIERYIQVIAKNMTLYGVTQSIGRLYGVLYFSETPMTLDDMRDALEMSKTSMSTGIRTLADMDMVEPTLKKGVRKDLYQSDRDWYKSFTSLFSNRWKKYTETNIEQTNQAMEQLKILNEDTMDQQLKDKAFNDIKRLEDAKDYYTWLIRFINIVESGEIFELVPKTDSK